VIADEASGIPEPVYEAARGTMSTAGAIFILIGNPTRAKGLFFRTHTILKDLWWTRRVSCTDSTRVDPEFIEEMRLTYTEQSNQWRIRVLGEFPENDEDSVIPRELVEPALDRDVDIDAEDDVIWGVDPGRGGDPTGFIERLGRGITFAKELHFADTMRVVGWVFERWQNAAKKPRLICVDSIGVGAGVADRLRQMGLPVMDVNVAESPSMRDRFPRLRAELWFAVRGWFERRDVRILCDPALAQKLMNELCEPSLIITANGKTDVESKAQMKQRGVASPNLADALMLTFAADGGIASGAPGSNSWSVLPWHKPHPKRLVGF
jgi:phage terminase large subunit